LGITALGKVLREARITFLRMMAVKLLMKTLNGRYCSLKPAIMYKWIFLLSYLEAKAQVRSFVSLSGRKVGLKINETLG
jgi:hypothetical protein